MNKQEKELAKLELKGERDVLEEMRRHYSVALDRVNAEIAKLADRNDLSGIRQRRYQEALAKQIGGIIDELGSGCYATLEDYLSECYEQGFVGTMYNLQKQGIPLAFPLDQESMARSVTMTAGDVKLSKRMYSNVAKLRDQVIAEITRGFADASHVTQVAERMAAETDIAGEIKRRVEGRGNQAFRRSMTIARTEKGRVLSESRLHAMHKAKEAGADVVKQWDSTMDSRTRDDHRKLDGQIRELDEPFEVAGHKGMAPHKFGRPEQDINCRCIMLQRSRTALEIEEGQKSTKWDGVNQCYVDLSDADSYQEFKTAWAIKNAEADIAKLTKDMARYSKQAADLEERTYANIWRDEVTVKDYSEKKGSIPSKRTYFKMHMHEDEAKFTALQSLLDDFERDGKKYERVAAKRKQAASDLKRKQRELAILRGEEVADDPYSDERKQAAFSFKTAKSADKELRAKSGEVWRAASDLQKRAMYNYTCGSGSFNRPLAGFEKPWRDGGSGWEPKFYKGPGKVWIDYEGRGDEIRGMTEAIEQSTYGFDMWLNRGCDFNAIESFLGLKAGQLAKLGNDDLQQYVDATGIMHNFISTGVAEGTGFTGKEVVMRIYAPEGTEMMYAEPFSHYGNGSKMSWDGKSSQSSFGGEAEMIIQRGARYTITSIEKKGHKLYVEMEVHPEMGYDKYQQDPSEWTGSKDKFK